ncbi:hypothetical protein V1520DRAFT_338286 [Lipomyces starkeyi]
MYVLFTQFLILIPETMSSSSPIKQLAVAIVVDSTESQLLRCSLPQLVIVRKARIRYSIYHCYIVARTSMAV